MMDWTKYIESNPEVLSGKPVLKGTRIGVDLVLEKLASGDSVQDIIDAYPNLTKDKINACLLFASESIKNEIIVPKAS